MTAPPILHVVTNLETGGAQTSVASIVRGLRARGIDARIAFSSRGGMRPGSDRALLDGLIRDDVPVYDLPAMRRAPSAWEPVALRQLGDLLRALQPAIVQTHASKAGLIGRLAAARAGIGAIVHTVRGWSFQGYAGARRALYVLAERRLAALTHRFVAVTAAMVDAGVGCGIGRREGYVVIRSGIELARFRRSGDRAALRRQIGIPADAPVVGTVMKLTAAKAPLDFVEVARRVVARLPRVHVLVVGDGPERGAVERAIRRSGVRDRFHLVGERTEVPALLGGMDVFVLTSRWEGMPRVVVEAAVAGVPVVATDVGGTREIVVDGCSGVLCSPGALDALAHGAVALLERGDWARRMAEAARARVTAEFDLERVVDAHVRLYGELVS